MNTRTWSRAALKERAQMAFKRSYWWCVLAALILSIVMGGSGGSSGRDKDKESSKPVAYFDFSDYGKEDVGDLVASKLGGATYSVGKVVYGIAGGVIGLVLFVVAFAVIAIAIILRVLLLNPLEVGGRKFFMENACEKKEGIGTMLDGFQNGFYGNTVVTMVVRDVKIFLWTLLLVIPGIVKAYEYRMVPYIIAEHPEMNYREALEKSSAMMNGQKMNAFILDLSFIGWHILTAMTCGIVGIFWTNPYYFATDAELYLELSSDDLAV
ncbi:MAG: DUF975 family protein [Acetatifactor sp.]|nr:DUF975 family protein [Acetatifactor sp.]